MLKHCQQIFSMISSSTVLSKDKQGLMKEAEEKKDEGEVKACVVEEEEQQRQQQGSSMAYESEPNANGRLTNKLTKAPMIYPWLLLSLTSR